MFRRRFHRGTLTSKGLTEFCKMYIVPHKFPYFDDTLSPQALKKKIEVSPPPIFMYSKSIGLLIDGWLVSISRNRML